ncbi:hypothetical protein SAMN05216452_2034 [Nitratireductor aquibiodomus]|uniref:Uncharacterized protein n=1 Tax=Nitratireductor aquibiodomus TaxID=204799 RepID=A0A1H4K7T2_9HYPH|nr:hypothetical protein SAMN05216452_2034 [Nitratireductor aquibiodomus]
MNAESRILSWARCWSLPPRASPLGLFWLNRMWAICLMAVARNLLFNVSISGGIRLFSEVKEKIVNTLNFRGQIIH